MLNNLKKLDIVFVRTKLQARIVKTLILDKVISNKFIFVRQFWKDVKEDSIEVYNLYDEISTKAVKSCSYVEKDGFTKNVFFIWLLSLLVVMFRGRFIFATIDNYEFAIVKKFNPFLKICTFDDGIVNIRKDSVYFSNKGLPNKNIKAKIVNSLLPNGSAYFLRDKIHSHFTIYKNQENIVEINRINLIEFDYQTNLLKKDIEKINLIIQPDLKILIGAAPTDYKFKINDFLEDKYKNYFDLVILHPRDSSKPSYAKNSYHFIALAEEVILYIESMNEVRSLEVRHFNSSAGHSLQKTAKLNVINIRREVGR